MPGKVGKQSRSAASTGVSGRSDSVTALAFVKGTDNTYIGKAYEKHYEWLVTNCFRQDSALHWRR